jgi:hypothetical protein
LLPGPPWFADYEGVVLIASTRVEHLKQLTDHIVDLSA